MTSLADRVISVYRNDGILVLGKKTIQKLFTASYCHTISLRGHYSLTLDDRTVRFSAPTPSMVKRNQKRFHLEYKELHAFLDAIKPADTVYDVGANTGLYSLFAATTCQHGTVVAFEPYPPNVKILNKDLARNRLHNIEVVESVLSNSVGETEFSQPEEDDIGYGSSSIDTKGGDDAITVPTTTGDRLVADGEIPPPNVIKIDVEGAEPLVIEGMKEVLSMPECRTVFCEVHLPGIDKRPSIKDFDSSLEELRSKLENFGFDTEKLDYSRDSEITIKATK